jgi:DNA (cytosine-5)-methyltransferase 1
LQWPDPTHGPLRLPYRTAREIIDWSLKGRSAFNREKPLAANTIRRIMVGLQKFGLKEFIVPQQQGGAAAHGVDSPVTTITTAGAHRLAQPFLVSLRGTSPGHLGNARSVDEPLRTVSAAGTHAALVQPFLLQLSHGSNTDRQHCKDVDAPLPTVTCAKGGDMALAQPYLIKWYGTANAASIDHPLGTVTANDRFALCQPRVEIAGEQYLVDVDFRMLTPGELASAQGFPTDYIFTGTKTEQVRQIGNAVPCGLSRALGHQAMQYLN